MDLENSVEKELRRGRARAWAWGFATWMLGSSVSSAMGLPTVLAAITFGVLAVGVFLFLLRGSFDADNVLREAARHVAPIAIGTREIREAEPASALEVAEITEGDYFLSTEFDAYLRETPWLREAESKTELDWELTVPATPTDKIVSIGGRSYYDVSDYGTELVPPSEEAMLILAEISEGEKINLHALLHSLQSRMEKVSGTPGIILHPTTRACLWAQALAKISDHYYEVGNGERTLFFIESAWNLSRHPIFGVQLGVLLLKAGNVEGARYFFQNYLADYQNCLKGSNHVVNPFITQKDLEYLAARVREKLVVIGV
jgi:hypothetical protein